MSQLLNLTKSKEIWMSSLQLLRYCSSNHKNPKEIKRISPFSVKKHYVPYRRRPKWDPEHQRNVFNRNAGYSHQMKDLDIDPDQVTADEFDHNSMHPDDYIESLREKSSSWKNFVYRKPQDRVSKQRLKTLIIRKKEFKEEFEKDVDKSISFEERDMIRYLRFLDKKKWSIEQLSESFGFNTDTIRWVLNIKYKPEVNMTKTSLPSGNEDNKILIDKPENLIPGKFANIIRNYKQQVEQLEQSQKLIGDNDKDKEVTELKEKFLDQHVDWSNFHQIQSIPNTSGDSYVLNSMFELKNSNKSITHDKFVDEAYGFSKSLDVEALKDVDPIKYEYLRWFNAETEKNKKVLPKEKLSVDEILEEIREEALFDPKKRYLPHEERKKLPDPYVKPLADKKVSKPKKLDPLGVKFFGIIDDDIVEANKTKKEIINHDTGEGVLFRIPYETMGDYKK